jgi:hypothetical protein
LCYLVGFRNREEELDTALKNTKEKVRSLEVRLREAEAGDEDDEDMATMLMSMRGAWIGEDLVQQGFPSQQGGPRLIRLSPRGGDQKQFKFEPSSESRSSAQ